MTLVKLTEEDKKFLREMMYEDEKSINQIEKALDKTIFELDGKRITAEEARKILGDEDFLSGLDRSSFHVDAVRYTEGSPLKTIGIQIIAGGYVERHHRDTQNSGP